MLKKILSKMDEMGSFLMGPALSDEKFEQLVDSLNAMDIDLPDEYTELLFICDGLYWGGMEFFASSMHTDKKRGFTITDLVSQNRLFQALNPAKENCCFIGRTDDENYIFNPNTNKYEIIEEFEGTLIKSFDNFESLFEYVVEEQIELVQNFVAFDETSIKDEASDEDF
ncbi:MAG: hypothetical protein E7013_02075 [Alphaproteobacteria bacterium]|nr:hypothetical protein [Alphaproteobacteria bacterium]